jgi:glycosyltransferase involved in cell wall biosynthesis
MKWYVCDYDAGGTWNLAKEMATQFTDVRMIGCNHGEGISQADLRLQGPKPDLIHFWNAGPLKSELGRAAVREGVPFCLTVHHLPCGYEPLYVDLIKHFDKLVVHTIDPFTTHALGQHGIYNVMQTKQWLPAYQGTPRPEPETFTVGAAGDGNSKLKRFGVIRAACEEMGVEFKLHDSSKGWISAKELDNFYRSLSVYVVASFNEGGPLPAQEAMQRGVPVVSTRVGQMPRLLSQGLCGIHFDGSREGLIQQLEMVRKYPGLFSPEKVGLPTAQSQAPDLLYLYNRMEACQPNLAS